MKQLNIRTKCQDCKEYWDRVLKEENEKLKQQLKEKEQEIEMLKLESKNYCEDFIEASQQLKQSQNQKAIEVLEMVKSRVPDFDGYDDYDCIGMYEFIDQLKKELSDKV